MKYTERNPQTGEWSEIDTATHSWEHMWDENDDGESYTSGNYVTDGNSVVDYDGVFELPAQVVFLLIRAGYDVSEIWDV